MAFILACASGYKVSATVVAGQVKDGFSGAAIAGAQVTLLDGANSLGHASSGQDGLFQVVFDLGAQNSAKNLTLDIQSNGYTSTSKNVVVSGGRTDQNSYQISLVGADVSACRRNGDHLVVVGYFRQPTGVTADLQLADRIKDSLDYDVLVQFQKFKISQQFQPIFLTCEKIEPKADVDYGNYAKVLGADAFLSGRVAAEGTAGFQKVKVDMSIGDRYGLLDPPVHSTTQNVDLDDPATTRLQNTARLAIFSALINSYEHAAQSAQCVQAANAAEQATGKLPASLSDARKRCAAALPNAGLLR